MLLPSRWSLARCILASAVLGLIGCRASRAAADDSIQPWPADPWYWQLDGQPVFLAGGTDDDNLFQWPQDRLIPQLDRLAACGGNYVRNTMSDRQDQGFELYPFQRLPDGRYDLEQWNDAYWERFEAFLEATAERNIVVQIEVWDRFDYSGANWPRHPYNPANNVNYTHASSGLAAEYPEHAGRNLQPFFYTVPTLRDNRVVYYYQERFVDRLLAYALKHRHVLYCMDNETSGAEAWGRWWAEHIKRKAAEAGRRVCVTEMWDAWDLKTAEHRRTFDHPELYDYVDVSQNNHKKGQEHWDNFQWVKQYLARSPRPVNTVKTYGADGNKFGHTDLDGLERVWRHVLGGAAAVRFHRPDSGLGLSPKAQATLRSIRLLEQTVKVWALAPHNEWLRDREPNEAYAAASADGVCVVLFTHGGQVVLHLPDRQGDLQLQWLDIGQAALRKAQPAAGGASLQLTPPDGGLWLALLTPL